MRDMAAELPAELVLGDGARYPAIWLRGNCGCAACAAAGNGRKLFGITGLPADPRIESADLETGSTLAVLRRGREPGGAE
jgi:hypothetical protein